MDVINENGFKKVCFFDSGIGGLNLLYESMLKLPNVDFYYFADNYNVPYGNRGQSELIEIASVKFAEMAKLNPSVAVIACNTVTARCADYLRKKYPFPIVGIQPAIKPAAQNCGKCIVLATPSTAKSEAVCDLVKRYGNGVTEVYPCHELAAFIEENIFDLDEEKIIPILPQCKAESVVLGCTHYIFVKETVEKKYACKVFDGAAGTVNRLCYLLGERGSDGAAPRGSLTFVGGDAQKNCDVFCKLLWSKSSLGEIFPKISQ